MKNFLIQALPFVFLVPFAGFILSLFFSRTNEKGISRTAIFTASLQLILAVAITAAWFMNGTEDISVAEIVLYQMHGYEFLIDLYLDALTVTYMLVGAIISLLVIVYSSFYMHQEWGYRRFFSTVLFFIMGYNATIIAGNFETLFIGWETLGISSFLLIAYYRDRYLPVKNAVKVFSIYRLGDIGIILAMWLSHQLWHENITFIKLHNTELVHEHLISHSFLGSAIALCILFSAVLKSAQFPVSSWLARAMEGPTPSSAIFYGSLAVHFGVFLLLRTFPFWEEQTGVRVLIVVGGLLTFIIAGLTGRVQSSIKAQVAYASIAQIGLMFIEVGLGLQTIALIHFAANAFLRTYQLLISPSIVAYLIKDQFYNYQPVVEKPVTSKWVNTIYMLGLNEWNFDSYMYKYLWNPLKSLGNGLNLISEKNVYRLFLPMYILGIYLAFNQDIMPFELKQYLPSFFAMIGLFMVLKSFTERKSAGVAYSLIILNHLWIALAISFNDRINFEHLFFYLSGVVVFGLVGYLTLHRLKKFEGRISLEEFQGHSFEHPKLTIVFFIACLGLAGFPISPTFIGEDLIFSHIQRTQLFLTLFVSLSFIIDGIALIRIYARLFLGPHIKTYHETAHRSS